MEHDQNLLPDWPLPLERRFGGEVLLDGIEIWHDFDWMTVIGHDRGVFHNCKSIGRKVRGLTPDGLKPVLLLSQRSEVSGYSVLPGPEGQVVHVLNIGAARTVAADAADTLVGHHALPDVDINATIRQLEALPQALDELVARNLDAQRIVNWATRDDESIREITAALTGLDAKQLGRVVALAFAAVAAVGKQPGVLREFSLTADESLLALAVAGANYAHQSAAMSELESLLPDDNPEQVYQTFFEEHHWMFGSRFIGRWPGRQITLGDQQDFIMQTADGFFDLIELKLPSDDVLRWDRSHQAYYPSQTLSMAIGQVQKYLSDIDNDLHRIRSEFDLDVHRARAVIVIGRLDSGDEPRRIALRGLNAHLNRIEIWTYTQVVAMARAILNYTQVALDTS